MRNFRSNSIAPRRAERISPKEFPAAPNKGFGDSSFSIRKRIAPSDRKDISSLTSHHADRSSVLPITQLDTSGPEIRLPGLLPTQFSTENHRWDLINTAGWGQRHLFPNS